MLCNFSLFLIKTYQKIFNRNLKILNIIFPFLIICLTIDPGYLSANDKKFIITTEEWPPFISSNLPNNGWTMEVARAALESQGYDVVLQLLPWARALRCSESGKCDGLYLSYYVPAREEFYVFSDPVAELETGFFKLKDRDISYETLEDLRPYSIGMTRGASVSKEFDAADYLKKDPVPDDTVNIKKLLRGRVDLIVAAKPVLEYLVKSTLPEDEQSKIEFVTPPLSVQNLHMAISKNSPDYEQKLHDFNEGLKKIKADGTYEAIRRASGY